MVQTTKYVTWRQLKAGMEIHGYKQEGRTCFCKGTVQAINAAYVTILLWGTTLERIASEETMFDVEMSREEFMQIHKAGAVEVMNALRQNLVEYETGDHAMDNGWIRYDPYEMAAHCKDRHIKVVGVYPHREKILHTRDEMESVARIYEEANTRNRGGTRISRNRAFDVGEFGRWIRKGVHMSKTVEEYVSWGNQIFVIDYADDWKLYPARTTQELLDTLRRFEGSPDIGVIFGDKRKLYRPKKAKGWHS